MKKFIILFLLSIATISQAHQVEPPFQYSFTVTFPQNSCLTNRAISSAIFAEMDAALALIGPNMVVTEIIANSYEIVGGVPLCQCRYNTVLTHINMWETINNIPQTTSPMIQGCVTHPSIFSGNPPAHMSVTVVVNALL